jgi:uncharacterized protein
LTFLTLEVIIVTMKIKRHILKHLQQEITRPEVLILLGPRQVGKTTVLKMLQDHCRQQGYSTAFFDLEQPLVLASFNRPDAELTVMIAESADIVFIDEFQYVANMSRILKAIFDSGRRVKIICSGSSALAIHTHLKESLAGRRFLYRLFPLSFSELSSAVHGYDLSEYLRFGGMPGLTHTESPVRKQQILQELLNSYILKDIKSLVKEENMRAFNHLLYLLAEKQGSVISVHSLARDISMSSKAVNHYMDILEQTYVNFRLSSYSQNLGNELRKSCKTYFYDIGMRNILLKDFSGADRKDYGSLLESFVFFHLQARLKPNMEIKFWRTKDGAEVDFIVVKDRRPIPIEVKATIDLGTVPAGLKRFLARYPETKKAYIVSAHARGTCNWKNHTLAYLRFEDFAALDLGKDTD